MFADDDFGINRQRAAAATSVSAETKAKVTRRRDAFKQTIDQRLNDGFASQVSAWYVF